MYFSSVSTPRPRVNFSDTFVLRVNIQDVQQVFPVNIQDLQQVFP
jgi:hypothetical protein